MPICSMYDIFNIYLQNWVIYGVHVAKYSSTMEHLGNGKNGGNKPIGGLKVEKISWEVG